MKKKDIVRKFTFTKEELERLQNAKAGIIVTSQQLDGLHIFQNAFLSQVYQRLGIDGDPQKGYSKTIQFNLQKNEIVYTESPLPPEKKEKKEEKKEIN